MANTPPEGTEFAIPDFNTTENSIIVSGEPGTYQAIATNQPKYYMNGIYTTTGSHFFTGGYDAYSSSHCFERNGIPLLSSDNIHYYGPCWESRSGSNIYREDGTYSGSTYTIVDGKTILGEYVSISSPYGIILKSYSLISSNYNGVSTPCSGWVIGGSNDGGQTYTLVDEIVNTPLPVAGYQLFNTNNSVGYTTYIIIITTITNGNGAANIGTWNIFSLPQELPISQTCFPAGTRIRTNQGFIPIDKIDPSTHTIRNKVIVAITQTVSNEKHLICFEKDSLAPNLPCERTVISRNHSILVKGRLVKAKHFIGRYENVRKVKYTGEILYNVLMEEYDKMVVNNLIVETLDPRHYIAKLYSKNYTVEERTELVAQICRSKRIGQGK